ncbi:TVP38/TMEM64 family protein [bacterium]|nr:MAG: TVP38/TMEM64 family protein [bacterium]
MLKRYRSKIKFIVFVAALVLICYLGRYIPLDVESIQKSLGGLPVIYSALLFIFLYVAVTFFVWLAKDLFKVIAAFLFGAFLSTILIWLAEVINACILFFLARGLGRGFVAKTLVGRYGKLDDKLARVNFLWLFLFRAVPLIPFRFLDLTGGLTRIPFKKYLAAVVLGSPVRIFWVQYILVAIGKNIVYNPQVLSQYLISNKALFIFSLAYLGLVIAVALKIKE